MLGVMDGDLPSVDSLRCFVAVAEQLSFRRAAAEVALTPAALTQRIKQLEDQLGCRLFDRSPRHVEPTPEGQALLGRARAALESLRACRTIAADRDHEVRMTVGTRFELGLSWLVPTVLELRRERPGWWIDLTFGSGPEILSRLEAGRVDAVVTSAPTARAGWTAEPLHPERYVLVGEPARMKRIPLRAPDDAAAHVIIDVDEDLPLTRYLLSVQPGLSFGDTWRAGTGAAVLALVRAGEGVAVLPEYMVRQDLAEGRLQRLLPEVELLTDSFRLLFRTTSPLAQTLHDLADQLRARPLR